MRDAEAALGLKEPVAVIGYVFSESFAAAHKSAIDRFIAVAREANDIMLRSDEEWDALRPLMNAEDDRTFKAYRDRTREGMPRRPIAAEASDASALFRTLAAIGGADLVGPSQELDPGLYYQPVPRAESKTCAETSFARRPDRGLGHHCCAWRNRGCCPARLRSARPRSPKSAPANCRSRWPARSGA